MVHFYNGRGTAEQWKEGKYAMNWTRACQGQSGEVGSVCFGLPWAIFCDVFSQKNQTWPFAPY